jgi:hypothetical protein
LPKLEGWKEQRHQPFYDTLVRVGNGSAPNPLVQGRTQLFGSNNIGNLALTNMSTAGVLASDQTFKILGMRAWLYFRGPQSSDLYSGCASQLFFTLVIGDKPQFQMPCWYFPSGGGVSGMDPANPNLNLGTPDHRGFLKLAEAIPLPARQGFNVIAEFFPIGATDVRGLVNSAQTGDRVIQFVIDGIHVRDVL